MSDRTAPRFVGPIAALVTPFDADENIAYDVLETLIESVLDQGVTTIAPASVSGEVFSLSFAERADVMRAAARYANGRAKLLACTFSTKPTETVELCHLATELDYQAAIVTAPLVASLSPDEILGYFRWIDQQVSLPIIIYNYPGRFVTDITPSLVVAMRPSTNLVAYKDTSGRLDRLQDAVVELKGELEIICGFDDLALESYAYGVRSILGGSVCFLAKQHAELLQAVVQDNDARRGSQLIQKLLPLFRFMGNSSKYVQMCKLGCELAGIPVGRPRSPLLPLSEKEAAHFSRLLRTATENTGPYH